MGQILGCYRQQNVQHRSLAWIAIGHGWKYETWKHENIGRSTVKSFKNQLRLSFAFFEEKSKDRIQMQVIMQKCTLKTKKFLAKTTQHRAADGRLGSSLTVAISRSSLRFRLLRMGLSLREPHLFPPHNWGMKSFIRSTKEFESPLKNTGMLLHW